MTCHTIKNVLPGSIAEEMEIEAGDKLLAINNTEIEDVFDYQFLVNDEYIEVLIEKADGEQWELEIEKDFDEDLGIEFENGLMDDYRSCCNRCIFCFIDQMPKGMRDTLYFKDDDSRLSFLQGNYVTLTNMKDKDIERIIRYNLSPINISFQTTNPELRCRMLNNKKAGEALKKVDRLYEAGIEMNGQIVLCKGINDGAELERSIEDLSKYLPNLTSVSVVPVGLTKYREGLEPLEPFTREDARHLIDTVESWQKKLYPEHGTHFIHASDEWYILAGRELPEEESYDGYPQLENGVGMIRLLVDEFTQVLDEYKEYLSKDPKARKQIEEAQKGLGLDYRQSVEAMCLMPCSRNVGIVTAHLAYPYLKKLAKQLNQLRPDIMIDVYDIENEFFGPNITVSGLITGQDIIKQLKPCQLGEELLIPANMLRSGETVFLDDVSIADIENDLQVKVRVVELCGADLLEALLGEEIPELHAESKEFRAYEQ